MSRPSVRHQLGALFGEGSSSSPNAASWDRTMQNACRKSWVHRMRYTTLVSGEKVLEVSISCVRDFIVHFVAYKLHQFEVRRFSGLYCIHTNEHLASNHCPQTFHQTFSPNLASNIALQTLPPLPCPQTLAPKPLPHSLPPPS